MSSSLPTGCCKDESRICDMLDNRHTYTNVQRRTHKEHAPSYTHNSFTPKKPLPPTPSFSFSNHVWKSHTECSVWCGRFVIVQHWGRVGKRNGWIVGGERCFCGFCGVVWLAYAAVWSVLTRSFVQLNNQRMNVVVDFCRWLEKVDYWHTIYTFGE